MKTIHKVQGTGSGADLAASIFGGILVYRMEPFYIEPLKLVFPITVVYSGSKLPTTQVINIIEEKYKRNVELFSAIFNLMDIERNNWKELGEIFNINQGLMDAIGVSNLLLSEINYKLREDTGIYGTKISGSGLGDCIIGVGTLKQRDFSYPVIPLEISSKGIVVE